jgi:hypothetical protein
LVRVLKLQTWLHTYQIIKRFIKGYG